MAKQRALGSFVFGALCLIPALLLAQDVVFKADGVQLFEELFDRPMDEIEAGWKDYVLKLQ